MEGLPDNHVIELFQLLFLQALAVGPRKASYILKGGCNLRFFFDSIRHSDDLDMDVAGVPRETLRKTVDNLLASPALVRPLAVHGIEIVDVSSPKQTDTTQRWKLGLRTKGRTQPVRTKIEFSRRRIGDETGLESISEDLSRRYRTSPAAVCHYLLPTAVKQKIEALAGRHEARARDIFDLAVLMARPGSELHRTASLQDLSAKALKQAATVTYARYLSEVVAYLPSGEQEHYATREAWEEMRLRVTRALEILSR